MAHRADDALLGLTSVAHEHTLPSRRMLLGWSFAGTLAGATTLARAASPLQMNFVTHAAFFSGEMKLPEVLDPHVFVRDSVVAEGAGPQ